VVNLVKAIFSSSSREATARLDRLKERYARNEISEDEYNRMKTELS
jgi:uncharacterized membrane protein